MSMQLHGMKQMMKATEYANPGQTPVLVSDSPIYQALKKLQWLYPDEVGEKRLVLFMGLLHYKMMKQECGRKLMGGSGWDEMFVKSGIFTNNRPALLSFCAAQLMKTPLAADVVFFNTIGVRVLCSNLDADLDLM